MLPFFKELFLGNWRNKGVALFFAVTIWFVAYQSELMNDEVPLRVDLVVKQEDQVIISKQVPSEDEGSEKFDYLVYAKVTGSRKQIDSFRTTLPARVEVEVDASLTGDDGSMRYKFNVEDMDLPDAYDVEIVSFSPAVLDLELDLRDERGLGIEPIKPTREGWEAEIQTLEPQTIRVAGPQGILGQIVLFAQLPEPGPTNRYEGTVPVQVRHESLDEESVAELIQFVDPPEVRMLFQLNPREDSLGEENVKVRFLLPPLKTPFEIQFTESTIPVRFSGPELEIQRLRERVKDPDFYVAVEPDLSSLQTSEGSIEFTFSEDELILPGFSNAVRKMQHRNRRDRGPFVCTISLIQKDDAK